MTRHLLALAGGALLGLVLCFVIFRIGDQFDRQLITC